MEFEPATFRKQGTEPTTEPPRPTTQHTYITTVLFDRDLLSRGDKSTPSCFLKSVVATEYLVGSNPQKAKIVKPTVKSYETSPSKN